MTTEKNTIRAYEMAKERFATLGVDTEKAMDMLQHIALSLHCWQTDDVTGFENLGGSLTGGIQVTGNYPGRARTIDEVRADALKVMSLVPGKHRFSLHATYGDFQGKVVDRNEIEPAHFQSWMEWAKDNGLKLDFNSTSFSHPKSGSLTLANPDGSIRRFWIEHTKRCRWISEEAVTQALGEEFGGELLITKVKSPTQVEKLLTARGMKKPERDAVLEKLVTRDESTKVIVVSEGDERASLAEDRKRAIELF